MVEGNGLENRRAGNGTVGSNPTLSANKILQACTPGVFYFGREGDSNGQSGGLSHTATPYFYLL